MPLMVRRGPGGLVAARVPALCSLAATGSFAVLSNQHVPVPCTGLLASHSPFWLVPRLFCTGPRHINTFSFVFFCFNTHFSYFLLLLFYFEPLKVRPRFCFGHSSFT